VREKTDAELVVMARSGNKEAFGQLMEHQLLRLIAVGMVNEDRPGLSARGHTASLLTQSSPKITSFKNWLYGIVLNVCRSYIRDQRQSFFSLKPWRHELRYHSIYWVVSRPQQMVEEQELYGLVLAAVKELSERTGWQRCCSTRNS